LPDASSGLSKQIQFGRGDIETKLLGRGWRNPRPNRAQGGLRMFFVAAILAILSGLFYAAGHHEIGSLGERCTNTAARFATIRWSCWSLPGWLRAGAHSSACTDTLVRKPSDFGDDGVMPVIFPTCQTSRSTESPPD